MTKPLSQNNAVITAFLHFFDVHFLEVKHVHLCEKEVISEARLATRFAFLCTDEVLIPASSFFETRICRQVINEFSPIYDDGGIWLVGGAANVKEFIYKKLKQYDSKSNQYRMYSDADLQRLPPFRTRYHSSTNDIKKEWINRLYSRNTISEIIGGTKYTLPRNFERRWERVPIDLEEKAFVVPYVMPLLLGRKSHPTIFNRLHYIINEAYFSSYVNEFCACIVDDLIYLASPHPIPTNGFRIPFRSLLRKSRAMGILNDVINVDVHSLLKLKNHERWKSCMVAALNQHLKVNPMLALGKNGLSEIDSSHFTEDSRHNKSYKRNKMMKYDIAILTVIGPELEAVQNALGCNNNDDRFSDQGSLFWKASFHSEINNKDISAVIHCISRPGNQATAAATTKIIERYKPKAIFLMGISAGIRNKIKIGDVVIPRAVVDTTMKVALDGNLKDRPLIPPLPHQMSQMIQALHLNKDEWHSIFQELFSEEIIPPEGKVDEYDKYVAKLPEIQEVAIASSDILLRDPIILTEQADRIHQQIKVGEMEAAGFITACHERGYVVPWLVVRGVSDFGDELKDDVFHKLASCAAASYLKYFLKNGFDLGLLNSS